MNILDRHYPEISFKTDAEDLQVIIDFINAFAEKMNEKDDKTAKINAIMLKEIRSKFIMKVDHKKGTTKKFIVKLKAYQISLLMMIFILKNDEINGFNPFEYNCISQYKDIFHKKITGL